MKMEILNKIILTFRWNSTAAFEINLGKFVGLILTCIQLACGIVIFTICLNNQLELALPLGLLNILSMFTSFLIFRLPQFVYFKLHLVIHCLSLVCTISIFPIATTWYSASSYLCDFIYDKSLDDSSIEICDDLLYRRHVLIIILILTLVSEILTLILDSIVCRRFRVMRFTAMMLREERRKKREEILQTKAERDRRRKEEQRRELKAKILLMKEGNISQYDRAVGEHAREGRYGKAQESRGNQST
jgi:signal transduction histidine kinase